MARNRKGGTAPLKPVKGRPGMFIYEGDRPTSTATEEVWREVAQRELNRGDSKKDGDESPAPSAP